MIWNKDAIDYSAGLDIYDNITNRIYTEEEAKALPKDSEIRHRLILKPRKIGCLVHTLEELNEIIKANTKGKDID